jgi:hypothetical protein
MAKPGASYVPPRIEKRERLTVVAQQTTSAPLLKTGGCFKEERAK